MIYCELKKAVADERFDGVRYWVFNETPVRRPWGSEMQQHRQRSSVRELLEKSDRTWKEHDNGAVTFIKNRFTGIMTPVDMREFFVVKLRARSP
jgi:hypothetical protein